MISDEEVDGSDSQEEEGLGFECDARPATHFVPCSNVVIDLDEVDFDVE